MDRLSAIPFQGFWMGGFEGADHVNGHGLPLDMVAASGHLDRMEEDHRRAAQAGLKCVRESIGWRLAESGDGRIDLGRALRVQASAHRHGLQVLWTLMHYGLPAGLSLHGDTLVPRLARFAAEVARVLGPGELAAGHVPVFTPVNEISFLAWAASQPGMFAPPNNFPPGPGWTGAAESAHISGYTVKRRLAAAAIAAVHSIRAELPAARFMHVEPVVHVVAPRGRDDLIASAREARSWQWQAWDILCGALEPMLGGAPELLDIVGLNHYHNGQWEVETQAPLDWASRDPRRSRFARLLAEAAQRYGRPVVVAETSHVGAGRAAWLHEMAAEVRSARDSGVPVQGLCIYPLVDRPDWQDPAQWHRSGLWHVDEQPMGDAAGPLSRYPEPGAIGALRQWQTAFGTAPHHAVTCPAGQRPVLLAFSHLRWDFVRHRSRHLLERLAGPGGAWRLLFVEEPLPALGAPWLDRIAAGPHIEVLVPHTSGATQQPGFDPAQAQAQQEALRGLLLEGLVADGGDIDTVWLTTPMAWPLVQDLLNELPPTRQHRRVIYDCADELSAFDAAPTALYRCEDALLRAADGIVCASQSLAASRRAQAGARLVVLANGVDSAAFSRKCPAPFGWDAMEAAALAPRGSGPQLGFAGVVDERMDLALVTALAREHPEWQIVIVGPVLKIDPLTLPRRSNIHWLGEQPYRLLPALMRRWQVAIVPFVDNLATRHATPLKAMEALSAGLAVVATRLPEMDGWRDAGLYCASCHASFIEACATALAEDPVAMRARRTRASARLRQRGWDATAARLSRWLQRPAPGIAQAEAEDMSTPRAGVLYRLECSAAG